MATSDQVQSLYIAYFGRPADSEGLKYWTADTETPLTTIADGFAATAEYKASVAGESTAQVINSFYVNLFNRNAEVEGLNFWLNEIALGKTTVQEVGVVIGQEAVNASPANDDTSCITNKFTAASQWTADTEKTTESLLAYSGSEGIAAGVAYMSSWGTAAPTAEETQASVDSLTSDNSTGETLDLSVFTDIADNTGYTKLSGNTIVSTSNFKLNGDSQTVNGTATTLQALDALADSSTSDKDVLNVTAGAGGSAQALVSNIESVNYEVTGLNGILGAGAYAAGFAGAAGAQATTFTGVKNFKVTGTVANNSLSGLSAAGTGASVIDASAVTGGNAASRFNINGDNVATTVTAGAVGTNFTAGTAVDTINLGAGDNTVANAGRGADVITVDAAGGTMAVGVTGSDTVTLTATVGNSGTNVVTATGTGTRSVDASTSTVAVSLFGSATAGATGANTLIGGSAADNISAGIGGSEITGGGGADTLLANNGGSDDFNYGSNILLMSGQTGNTAATADTITTFQAATDDIATGVAGVAFIAGGAGVAQQGNSLARTGQGAIITFAGELAFANTQFQASVTKFANDGGTQLTYVSSDAVGNANIGFSFIDSNNDGFADAAIQFTGLNGALTATMFIA